MEEGDFRLRHMAAGFLVSGVASFLIWSSPHVSGSSMLMLVIFNFLFTSLVFSLQGPLASKITLLLIGNIVGWLWNYVFSSLAFIISYNIGEYVSILYLIANPFINLIWFVPFWSVSMSVFASSNKRKTRGLT